MLINIRLIYTFIAFLPSIAAFLLNPINTSCITVKSNQTDDSNNYYTVNQDLYTFKLPPFSVAFLEIDLRHMLSDINTPIQKFKLKAKILNDLQPNAAEQQIIVELSQINKYNLQVTTNTTLELYYEITDKFQAYAYLLEETVAIQIVLGNYRIPEDQSSFLVVVQSKNRINLPYNKPSISPQYSGYFLKSINKDLIKSRMNFIETVTSFWSTTDSIALPYLPYFSNCKDQADNIYLNQMMQEQKDCSLVPQSQIQPINQFLFGSSAIADSCSIKRQCLYDQIPGKQTEFPYWPTLPTGSALFSITRKKISFDNYQINRNFADTELIQCKINQSSGINETTQYPLKVLLKLQYHQETPEEKSMVKCNIQYSLYVQAHEDFQYQLEVRSIPMTHTNIMLAFGFQWYVYMIVFVIIGALSNLENLILWLFHSLVSKKENKTFRIKIYLRVIWQIGKGTLIGLFLCIILLFVVMILMNGKIFDIPLYTTNISEAHLAKVLWDPINFNYIEDYNSQTASSIRAGRTGLSFLLIGCYVIFYTSKYFIGCQKPNKEYNTYEILGRKLYPREYNRGKFIFGTFFFIFMQFIFIYFAYSKLYSSNIWTFIVLMKIIQMFIQEITKSIYEDILPFLPLKVITDITAYMNTLSANNFYDFLFSFLIDVAITMIEKAYISQLQNIVVEKIQEKIDDFNTMYYNFIHDNEANEAYNLSNQSLNEDDDENDSQNNQVVIVDFSGNGNPNFGGGQIQLFSSEIKETYNQEDYVLNRIDPSSEVCKLQEVIYKTLSLYKIELNKQVQKKFLKSKNNKSHKQNPDNKIDINSQEAEKQSIQKASSIFQLLLDNIVLVFTFFLQPFVILVYWISYDESGILGSYGISSSVIVLYLLSAIVIAFFTIINIILIFHLLESYLQLDFEQPIHSLLQRFGNRNIFWKAEDEDINKGIGETLRGADHYCLSWQFFFILTVYISSMVLVMLGTSILMNISYNPFKDFVLMIIIPFWWILMNLSIKLIKFLGFKFNIDGWADFQEGNNENPNAIGDISIKDQYKRKSISSDMNMVMISDEGFTNQNLFEKNSLVEDELKQRKINKKIFERKSTHHKLSSSPLLVSQSSSNNLIGIDEDKQEENERLQIHLETICHKLQKQFQCIKFCEEYFNKKENKEHLMAKIWHILQTADEELPQLPEEETNIMMQLETNNQFISENEISNKIEVANKNYEPSVVDLATRWKTKADDEIKKRHINGKGIEEKVSECQYCYETWGLYYGFQSQVGSERVRADKSPKRKSICLKCSKVIQNQINYRKKVD